jgi:hypothetical protein
MDNLDLKQFNTACDDFVAGKYILANIKIKALINSINASDKLTNLVSNCLDGFDFGVRFRESISSSGLVLPHEDKEIIAYCFNILYNLDEEAVTLLDFLSKYFISSKMSGGEEFKAFTNVIIEPFKKAINDEYQRVYLMTSTEDYQNNLFHKLARIAEVNINSLENLRLKQMESEELSYILQAIIDASDRNDKKMIYALMVGLDYFVKANKRAKEVYLQLKDCFEIN